MSRSVALVGVGVVSSTSGVVGVSVVCGVFTLLWSSCLGTTSSDAAVMKSRGERRGGVCVEDVGGWGSGDSGDGGWCSSGGCSRFNELRGVITLTSAREFFLRAPHALNRLELSSFCLIDSNSSISFCTSECLSWNSLFRSPFYPPSQKPKKAELPLLFWS